MDSPHSSPEQLYELVTKEIKEFINYIESNKIQTLSSEIHWKKTSYGASCTVLWQPIGKWNLKNAASPLKETTIIINDHYTFEGFRHFLHSEMEWINKFLCA